jgi:hypothetical protein
MNLVDETHERQTAAPSAAGAAASEREAECVQPSQASLESVRNAADDAPCGPEDRVASLIQERDSAREAARLAAASEAKLRKDLTALRSRWQDIVDEQMLQLTELKRELERTRADARRAREEAGAVRQQDRVRVHQQGGPSVHQQDANVLASGLRPSRFPGDGVPRFDAIEAVLAKSPPLPSGGRPRA